MCKIGCKMIDPGLQAPNVEFQTTLAGNSDQNGWQRDSKRIAEGRGRNTIADGYQTDERSTNRLE